MRLCIKLCLKILAAGLLAGHAQAAVIYYDDFSGASTENLRNTTPDIAAYGQTWVSAATTPWHADGSIDETGVSAVRTAYLPFAPEPGKIYTLSLDVNPLTGSHWFALGFLGPGAAVGGSFTVGAAGASPWMFLHQDRTRIGTYGGPDVQNGKGLNAVDISGADWSGTVNLKIVLNTMSEHWTAEWFVNGNSVRVYEYASGNPSIHNVGFSRQGTLGGAIDNFLLSASPEPDQTEAESVRIIGWKVPGSARPGETIKTAMMVDGVENTEFLLCVSHGGRPLWGKLLPYFGRRAAWEIRPRWLETSLPVSSNWPGDVCEVSVIPLDGQVISGVTGTALRLNEGSSLPRPPGGFLFSTAVSNGVQETAITSWQAPEVIKHGETVNVSLQTEKKGSLPLLLRLSYQDRLVWSTLQTDGNSFSFTVDPDWPDGSYRLSAVSLPGHHLKGTLDIDLKLGEADFSAVQEVVDVAGTENGWKIFFPVPRQNAGLMQIRCYDPEGFLRAVSNVPYGKSAKEVIVEYPRGGRWGRIPVDAELKLVFPGSSIEETHLSLPEKRYVQSNDLMKPMSAGCYVAQNGLRHYWHVDDDHTLIWDGAPYIPRGGMFCSDHNSGQFYSTFDERWNGYIKENNAALDIIQESGFHDLYVNHGVQLRAPEWHTQAFVNDLNRRGIKFGYQLTAGANPIDAYSIYSSVKQGLIIGTVDQNSTLKFTAPREHLLSALLVPVSGTGPAFEVEINQDLKNSSAGSLEIIQMEVAEASSGKDALSIKLSVNRDPGQYFVILKEKIKGKRASDVWTTLEETKRDLKWIEKINWGEGLRFFVDPVCNETGINNAYETRRFWSSAFNTDFKGWLEKKYHNDLGGLKRAWALPEQSISSFTDAAQLIPLRNTDEGVFTNQLLMIDPGSHAVWRTEGGLGVSWLDYIFAVRELYSYKNDEIARFIKELVNVPVVSKRVTPWVVSETLNRVPGGIDGLGLELYAKSGSVTAYGAVCGRVEAEASSQTTWFLVTEIGYDASPNGENWPSKEILRRHMRECVSNGTKGMFHFGWKLPVKMWGHAGFYDKPLQLKWLQEAYADLEKNPPAAWKNGLLFPGGANWWNRSGDLLWNRYNCIYDRIPSGFPQSVCLWQNSSTQFWAASSSLLFPAVDPVVMNLQDNIYVDYYEQEINRLLQEDRRIIYCGFWPGSEKCPDLAKHFTDNTALLADGSSIQKLVVFPGDQVLAKEQGQVWAKRSGSLLISSRTPVIGRERNVMQAPVFMKPEWVEEFIGDILSE